MSMCKAWRDAQEEAARKAAVLTFIESARYYGVAENTIIDDVMNKYNLTEEQTREYMMGKINSL